MRVIFTMDGLHNLAFLLLLLTLPPLASSVANSNCQRQNTSCIALNSTLCMGVKLPFTHTSLMFANDSATLDDVTDKLYLWSGLQNVPQCWAVVQPYLCSVYLPKCDDNTMVLEYPSREVCERTRGPCKIVDNYNKGWPDFLQCDQPYFKTNCETDTYEKITFNTTGRCEPPLIATRNKESWYEDVDGCGLQCQNPLFTDSEHRQVHIFVAFWGSVCLITTCFTVLTFVIDWKNASRYPALILFFINGCFFIGSIGWLAQFAGDARNDIVCRSDGTVRSGEPQLGSGETASCTVIFLLVYYFMMAGITWFVMLAYAWHVTFKALGTPRDDLTSKTAYFHLISWCLPLVLSIICLAISEIDGDSLSGICFVGYTKNGVRAGFVLGPVAVVLVCGMFFLIRGLMTLIKIRKDVPMSVSAKATSKIRETILRLGIFACLAFSFVIMTFVVHVYTFANEEKWRESFRDYMYCEANVTLLQSTTNATAQTCVVTNRPSLIAAQIHVFAFFGAGIAMSSWSWNKASLSSWERFLRKVFRKPSNKPVKLKKHKMIARAFEKRKDINNGRMSISFHSTHDDPLGMKLDLNSVSSHSVSSTFAAAMPKLIRRRGGVTAPVAGTLRRYSDSDIQSLKSHNSQLGFAIGQVGISDSEESREPVKKRKKKRKKRRRNKIQPIIAPVLNALRAPRGGLIRRGSNGSMISRASAHSVRVSVERQSVEAVSVSSMHNHSGIETIDLGQEQQTAAADRPKPDFSLFTASAFLPENNGKKDKSGGNSRTYHVSSRRSRRSEITIEMETARFFPARMLHGMGSRHGRRRFNQNMDSTIVQINPEKGSQSE
ncbi:smoothened homolog [Gigantopelta aegis]|uniref:smoothened homolog n=1 Tax=Gigantopelta aegis TaxID=1735272 RepID=UPI001B887FE2|nr:smoothened homolog [Gigantopelta aegis]